MHARNRTLHRFAKAAVLATASAVMSDPAAASEFYRLTIIAEGPVGSPVLAPSNWVFDQPGIGINNAGTVSFAGRRFAAGVWDAGIFIGNGQTQSVIATTSRASNFDVRDMLINPAINNRGQVGFIQQDDAMAAYRLWDLGATSDFYACADRPFGLGSLQLFCNAETLSDNTRTVAQDTYAGQDQLRRGFSIVAPPAPGSIVARIPMHPFANTGFAGAISRNGTRAVSATESDGLAFGRDTIVLWDPSLPGSIGRFTLPSSSIWVVGGLSANDSSHSTFVQQAGANTRPMIGAVIKDGNSLGLLSVADLSNGGFRNFHYASSISNLNEVGFVGGTLEPPASDALPYVGDISGRTPTPVARPGEVISADGTTFLGMGGSGTSPQSLNDKGQFAFYAHIRRPGTGTQFTDLLAVIRADPAPGVSPGNPLVPGAGDSIPSGGWRFLACSGGDWSPVPVRSCPPIVWLDPDLAVGYVYTVEGSGPNFKTVQIPAPLPNGDATFQVEFEGQTAPLKAGQQFDFTTAVPGGVRSFRITGIDVSEALDPTNGRAFVTGISFVDPNRTDILVTMVPIVDNPDDTDRDGVLNAADLCPNTQQGAVVDANGCSASQRDSDGDGVKDDVDRCPGTAAGAVVDVSGCSAGQRDSDSDGVNDDVDRCPGTAAGAIVDAVGCSAGQRDSDGDGVKDDVDQCPNTASGAAVDARGCSAAQRDSDGDGVPDSIDACPNTTPGTPVDAQGCPLVTAPRVCDANLDSVIDYRDIALILKALGATAGPNDPRDANRDGRITLIDSAICVKRCDRLFCRTP